MDKIDTALSLLLLQNSRMRYRELAEAVNLSVNAVHKRIQSMFDDGIIKKFKTQLSLKALGAHQITIFGRSEKENLSDITEILGESEFIYWISLVGGDFCYIGAYLRNINELEGLVSYVKKTSGISQPTIGIINNYKPAPPSNSQLDDNDYKILYALRNDSRKPVSQISEEINLSVKTVRYHLDKMIENNWIEFTIEWYPEQANDIISFFHCQIYGTADKFEIALELQKNYSPRVLFFWTYSNLPNLIQIATWSPTMKDLQDLKKKLQRDEFKSLTFNITYQGNIYDTWREKLVEEKVS
jgi:DNA-binding Lrp family transcriptional regulator